VKLLLIFKMASNSHSPRLDTWFPKDEKFQNLKGSFQVPEEEEAVNFHEYSFNNVDGFPKFGNPIFPLQEGTESVTASNQLTTSRNEYEISEVEEWIGKVAD